MKNASIGRRDAQAASGAQRLERANAKLSWPSERGGVRDGGGGRGARPCLASNRTMASALVAASTQRIGPPQRMQCSTSARNMPDEPTPARTPRTLGFGVRRVQGQRLLITRGRRRHDARWGSGSSRTVCKLIQARAASYGCRPLAGLPSVPSRTDSRTSLACTRSAPVFRRSSTRTY
jgi:hypothetical protein